MEESEINSMLNEARYLHNYLEKEDEAIKICDKILEHDPNNRDALLIKIGSLNLIGKEKEASHLIQEAINKWPEHWEAYYLLGLELFNINEKMAVDFFKKSIALESNFDNNITLAQLLYFTNP